MRAGTYLRRLGLAATLAVLVVAALSVQAGAAGFDCEATAVKGETNSC